MSPQRRTALMSIGAACLLIAIKLATGLASGSLGLLAEAAHSGTDLAAALLTFFAVSVAVRPADTGHPWGHGKAEHLAALAEATFLILVSVVIGGLAVAGLTGAIGRSRAFRTQKGDSRAPVCFWLEYSHSGLQRGRERGSDFAPPAELTDSFLA